MNTRTVLLWHNNGETRFTFAVNPASITVSRPNVNRMASLALGGQVNLWGAGGCGRSPWTPSCPGRVPPSSRVPPLRPSWPAENLAGFRRPRPPHHLGYRHQRCLPPGGRVPDLPGGGRGCVAVGLPAGIQVPDGGQDQRPRCRGGETASTQTKIQQEDERVELTAYDRGMALTRNELYGAFVGTGAQIVAQIAQRLGIATGSVQTQQGYQTILSTAGQSAYGLFPAAYEWIFAKVWLLSAVFCGRCRLWEF